MHEKIKLPAAVVAICGGKLNGKTTYTKEIEERLKEHTILYNGINVKYEAITADIIDELLKEYK